MASKAPMGHKWHFEQFIRDSFPTWFRSHVHFVGKMSHSEVMAVRTKCFATVVASQYEIAPYSILEAMSLGCPIVATAVGGIPELIRNRENGLLVACNDVKAMTDAINHLLDDHTLTAKIARQSWLDCKSCYSPEAMAHQTVTAYEHAIEIFNNS